MVNVFAPTSSRWADPRARLLTGQAWEAARGEVCRSLGHDASADRELAELADELDTAYRAVGARLPDNTAVRVETVEGRDLPVLTALDRLDEPASLLVLREQVAALLPRVDLPDLLLEVAGWTGFPTEFTHVSEGASRAEDLHLSVCGSHPTYWPLYVSTPEWRRTQHRGWLALTFSLAPVTLGAVPDLRGQNVEGRGVVPTAGQRDLSFDRAYGAHAPSILRFALRRVDAPEAAEDVVAEAFLAAWRQWERVPQAPDEVLPWLYRFAGSAVCNQRRSDRRQVRLSVRLAQLTARAGGDADPSEPLLDVAALIDAFGGMSKVDQDVLRLLAWEQVTGARELGLALGISPAAARVRIFRARQRLRARVAGTDLDRRRDDNSSSGVCSRPGGKTSTAMNVEA